MHIDLGNGYSLRTYLYGDAIGIAKHGDNPNIAQYLRDSFPQPYTLDQARNYVRLVKEHENKTRCVIDYGGEAIGDIGFVVHHGVHRYTAEMGFWLSEEHWGKGIMSKALQVMTDKAFKEHDLQRIFADVQDGNLGSRTILEKCGYELEATFKSNIFKDGKFVDQWVLAKYRE